MPGRAGGAVEAIRVLRFPSGGMRSRRSSMPPILRPRITVLRRSIADRPRRLEQADPGSHRRRALLGREETQGAWLVYPRPSDVLTSLNQALKGTLESGEDFDLTALILLILEALYRGAGFDRALFCPRPRRSARRCSGAPGSGDRRRATAGGSSTFRLSIRAGPLAAALIGKEDVFFVDASSPVRLRLSAS